MNRLTKQIVAIVSLTLIGCLYLQHVSQFNNFNSNISQYSDCRQSSVITVAHSSESSESSAKSLPLLSSKVNNTNNKKCRPHSNIVFIKAHKCASSAIQNIFMRYGYMNNKIFVLPNDGNYLGHPQPFQRSLVPDPRLFKSNYNILTHHSRLNYPEMRALMPNNTLFITIIRRPIDLFESMFHYYKLNKFWSIKQIEQFNQPNWTVPKRVKNNRLVGKIGINQMMFDMGMSPNDFNNVDRINKFIRYLDSIFSLVMVAERMDESLIFLKNLLCWTYDDVVVFKVNARTKNHKHKLNRIGIQRIEQLNAADNQLYEYFLKKFNEKLKNFGEKRMQNELTLLHQRMNYYYDQCVNKTISNSKNYIIRFVPTKQTTNTKNSLICQFLTNNELSLTKFLRQEQIKRYPLSVFH